ncbi:MAG TPA: VOC family protein [Pseudonocardiaceae bacterium]|jgi:predicted lactoylglutathione lyase
MSRTIFVNLPVHDLTKAIDFFGTLGFRPDRNVSGPDTARLIVSDTCSVMLHQHATFRAYTHSDVTDTAASREVIVGVSVERRSEVDDLVGRAVAAGGEDLGGDDQGFMYMRGFRDLDGHQWSLLHMSVG